MKIVFLIFIFSFSLNAGKVKITSQTKVEAEIDFIIDKLAKPFNLNQTIKAIVRVESDYGRYNINLEDPSCGVTHININTFMKRHQIPNTPFNRNKACQDLINSLELSIANSIEELLYWKSQFCKGRCRPHQWKKVWGLIMQVGIIAVKKALNMQIK